MGSFNAVNTCLLRACIRTVEQALKPQIVEGKPLMKVALCSSVIVAALIVSGAASAQPPGASQGIPGAEAVNPAPGATDPYVGAGRTGFYDVDARIAGMANRIGGLPARQRRLAKSQIAQIRSEEATQRARHGGDLRDWDPENLNAKLDSLVQHFPLLRSGVAETQ